MAAYVAVTTSDVWEVVVSACASLPVPRMNDDAGEDDDLDKWRVEILVKFRSVRAARPFGLRSAVASLLTHLAGSIQLRP